jgi:hypothetical protein
MTADCIVSCRSSELGKVFLNTGDEFVRKSRRLNSELGGRNPSWQHSSSLKGFHKDLARAFEHDRVSGMIVLKSGGNQTPTQKVFERGRPTLLSESASKSFVH